MKNIITIERQFASGGREIGEQVAKKLGMKFYNQEVLNMAASSLGVSAENVDHLEESTTNSVLYSIAMATSVITSEPTFCEQLYATESEIIKNLGMEGNCVIVGRCAGDILRENKGCLKVFIYADEESRLKRAVSSYGIEETEAHTILAKSDKRRKSFYNMRADHQWDEITGYDLCLNSEQLGISGCVEIITSFIEKRGK